MKKETLTIWNKANSTLVGCMVGVAKAIWVTQDTEEKGNEGRDRGSIRGREGRQWGAGRKST